MAISLLPQSLFICILSTTIIITDFTRAYSRCLEDQKTLLLELKNNLKFDTSVSRKLVLWNQTDDCCSWEGVECDGAGHVIGLQLDHEVISGALENSSSLFNLRYLQKLNMAYNSLNGSIPQSLFGLPSLQQLVLSNNQFSGQVDEFPTLYLSDMNELDLSSNRLQGPIPDSFFKFERLQVLSLSSNFFNGTFQLEKIQRLPNLTTLNLSYNNLSVDANDTNSSFSSFPQLYQLSLVSCNLRNFPDLRNQSHLRFLDLSNNSITGEIPSWIWEVGSGELWQLNLSSNHLMDLQKPYQIPTSLQILDLHSNQLRGELPPPQQRALYVDYSDNKFDKPIPFNIGSYLSSLIFFSLANNSLSGSIPTSLCDAIYLQVLDLSFNNLSGNIPPCLLGGIENLGVFNLRGNNITGNIPDKFSADCGLNTLDLSNNNLGGNIPKSLGNCKSLVYMNVGKNNIHDTFPCMLPSSLRVLVLNSNKFHGEVRCNKSWPDLQIIDISSNKFSGSLYPISFSSWKGMMLDSDAQLNPEHLHFNFLNLNNLYYQDELTLTIKGLQLKLVKISAYHISIDFSCNNFQGKIPDAIGDLTSLYLLNLSHNTLTGTIPKSFGGLTRLESLDLSANRLMGRIPVELAGLTFLEVLNLSHNNLVGMIPTGRQFGTFSPDYFLGNAGLCGPPLNISCSNTGGNNFHVQSHGKMEIETWDYVSAELGYVVGLGSFLWVLLCCQNLGRKYSKKVDEVLEKIFDRQHGKRRHGRRVLRNQVRRQ